MACGISLIWLRCHKIPLWPDLSSNMAASACGASAFRVVSDYAGLHAWFMCFLFLLPALSFTQSSNDSIFAQLKQQARTELADSVWQKATFGHEVAYLKTGKAWARTVALTATWGQAALDLSRTDTLSSAQVRAVRRASSPPFRGDAPGIWQKTLLPAIGLVAGTAVVAVLFYLRSR